MFKKKRIYLDNASATELDKRVLAVMNDTYRKIFANPSSIHACGVEAGRVLEDARAKVAGLLRAHADEIFFTGSATESNAICILGLLKNFKEKVHVITTNLEHPSVTENIKMLEAEGSIEVTYIDSDDNGIINPKDIRDAIKANTVLVSVVYASSEIGTIQPIQEIAKIVRQCKKEKTNLVFHSDATQAMNYLFTENIEKLGVDMLTFNASKIYGPKGVGAFYKKRSVNLVPIYKGGAQESGLRSGTENVALVCGMVKALEIANQMKDKEVKRLSLIQKYFFEQLELLKSECHFDIKINGSVEYRLPNNVNITIGNISSELLVIELDAKGFEVSERSACKAKDNDESLRTLRITFGRNTRKNDINSFFKALKSILKKYEKVL